MNFKSVWRSFDLGHYRPCDATYSSYSYTNLPPLPEEQFVGEFQWLEGMDMGKLLNLPAGLQEFLLELEEEEEMDEDEVVVDGPSRLEQLVASAQQYGLTLPPAFLRFMASPELRACIPSCTACYFDLAEKVVPCLGSEDGCVVRFLNDQQSVLTWYLYITPQNEYCVLASSYELGEVNLERPLNKKERRAILANTVICAPSFEAFLYRFWLENVIWYKLHARGEPAALNEMEQRYVDHYAASPEKEDEVAIDSEEDEDFALLRTSMERVLESSGWEKDSEGGFYYENAAFTFHLLCQMRVQPVIFLSFGRRTKNRADVQGSAYLHLQIECEEDGGMDAVLKEIVGFQTCTSLQNCVLILQNLIYAHSHEIAYRIGHEQWQTLSAVDTVAFTGHIEKVWQESLVIEGENYSRHYNEGIRYKQAGDHESAADAFLRAAKLAPAVAEAWHNVGFSQLALGQTEQAAEILANAISEYQRRLERYAYNAYNCFWLACVFSLLKKKEQALAYLTRAIEFNSDYLDEAGSEEDFKWLWQDADFLRLVRG